MKNCVKHLILILTAIAVSGCQSTPSRPAGSPADHTFGNYSESLESNLILITMSIERYAELTQRQPVPVIGKLPSLYASFIEELNSRYGIKRVANWPLSAIEVFCVVFEVVDTESRDDIVQALAQEPGVETAQLVQSFTTQAQPYNDPYLSLQHSVHEIQAINSHQWSRGNGVRIAIIDTGLDNTHPELESNTELTKNFVDRDDITFRSDKHGTAVGGVIAATTNNSTGMVGIAPDSTLLALKACWYSLQDPSKALCNSLTLAKALNYAINENVDIINLSLTGPPDAVLEQLVEKALSRNIVVIGAKPAHSEKAFPISVPGTIAVDMPHRNSQSIRAPGRKVLSIGPDEQYNFFNGSSFSTAHISGLAALLRSLSPMLTTAELILLMERSANTVTGVVNACRAVVDSLEEMLNEKMAVEQCR